MTKKQQQQFNQMHYALRTIAKGYSTPKQLRKEANGAYGLDYEEALEMAYENIQGYAAQAIKGIKPIANDSAPLAK